jgi:hypothetical protein
VIVDYSVTFTAHDTVVNWAIVFVAIVYRPVNDLVDLWGGEEVPGLTDRIQVGHFKVCFSPRQEDAEKELARRWHAARAVHTDARVPCDLPLAR